MPQDPILDLILQQDREIDEAIQRQSELSAQLSMVRQTLAKLITQREALEQIAIRKGWDVQPAPGEVRSLDPADWVTMPRTTAVEKVLEESSLPLHLTEIQSILRLHNRTDDSLEVISASLAHIKKTKGTVISLGGGRWEYNRIGTVTTNQVMDQLAADQRARLDGGMDTILSGGPHPENMPQGWTEGDDTHQPY